MKAFIALIALLFSQFNLFWFISRNQKEVVAPTIQKNSEEGSSPLPEFEEPAPEAPKKILPQFIEWPVVAKNSSEVSLYGDVMNHTTHDQLVLRYDRNINIHETIHRVNNHIRNTYNKNNTRYNAFYVFESKAVLVEEPKSKKSHVAAFVPPSLRTSNRYKTYVVGMSHDWDSQPLYLVDEWSAYVGDSFSNIEDVKTGRHNGQWTDGVAGCLDMGIYCVAMAMSVEKHDPEYWASNNQFRNFMTWHLERAWDAYKVGSKMREFKWDVQDRMLETLRTSPDAEEMRRFMRKHLSAVWLDSKE
jgi:hypothetical protein